MKTYETTIEVGAPQAQVWRVLTETLPREPEPFGILKLEDDLRRGACVKLWSEVAPDRAFALTVTVFDAPERMVWRGGMPFGLFTGTRSFTLSPTPEGTRFAMREVFDRILVPLLARSLPDLTPSSEKFSHALKERVENR